MEAGFKAGNALARRGRLKRAAETWWQVVDEFLVQNENPDQLGTRGRYWLARILAQLGEVMEQQNNLAEARRCASAGASAARSAAATLWTATASSADPF